MTRAAANLALAFWVLSYALLAGCAVPGEPTARHPVVPIAVADLTGRQSGNKVVLTFTLPTLSEDRATLAEAPAIEIFRIALPSGALPDRNSPWRLTYEVPSQQVDSYAKEGRVEFHDPLTAGDVGQSSGISLAYMVRTRIVKARASGDSNFFATHIYPPPPAPQDVRVSVTPSAIVVSWAESPTPSGAATGEYRVYRGEMESDQESALKDISQMKMKSPIELLGPSSSTSYDDSRFSFESTYVYTVRSVVRFGADSVESSDSVPVTVTARDTFPPAAPTGLEVAFIPATPEAPGNVELSWAISPEENLAGYNIYRSDSDETPGERINSQILSSPAFRDISVVPGKRYFYRVTALDRAGNESSKSSPIQTDVPLSGQ